MRRAGIVVVAVALVLAPLGTVAAAHAAVTPPAVASTSGSADAVPVPPSTAPGVVPRSACGDPLDDADVDRLVTLTAPDPETSGPTLDRLARRADAVAETTRLLAAHHDRRGLFGVGLDSVEREAVMPLQREGVGPDPEWARRLSLDLVDRYLAALHAHLTGATPDSHWERYLSLALDCRQRPAFVAMAGYNAHLTVDLARAVATSATRPEFASGYLRIVGAIADRGDLIVDRTRREYGADLGPLWHFYVVGDAVDAATASTGVSPDGRAASHVLLRFADQSYSSLTFAHGLGLENPALAPAVEGQMWGVWTAADVALQTTTAVGGL